MSRIFVLYILGFFVFLCNLFLALSVDCECREKGYKKKGLYVDISFFFGFIGYLIFKLKTKDNENARQKTSAKCRAFLAVSIVLFIFVSGFNVYSNYFIKYSDSADIALINRISGICYYDMKGNKCYNHDDMAFYDRNGDCYKHAIVEKYGVETVCLVNQRTYESFEYYLCFVDRDGFFYYDADRELEYSVENDCYYDLNGEPYFHCTSAEWNKNGTFIY